MAEDHDLQRLLGLGIGDAGVDTAVPHVGGPGDGLQLHRRLGAGGATVAPHARLAAVGGDSALDFSSYLDSLDASDGVHLGGDSETQALPFESASGGRSGEFCHTGNVDACLTYCNRMLEAYGYEQIRVPTTNTNDSAALLNSVYALLQQRQKDIAYRDDQVELISKLRSDRDRYQLIARKQKDRLDTLERDLNGHKLNENALEQKIKRFQQKWLKEKEDLRKQLTTLQSWATQYKHEARKKDHEVERLKDRLQQKLIDKTRVAQATITVSNPTRSRSRTIDQLHGFDDNKADLQRAAARAYETQNSQLRMENDELRQALRLMRQSVLRMRQMFVGTQQQQQEAVAANESMIDEQFELPVGMVRETLESDMHEHIRALKRSLREQVGGPSGGAAVAELEDELSQARDEAQRLCDQLDLARSTIAEQQRLLDEALDGAPNESRAQLDTSGVAQQRQELDAQMRMLDDKRANFDEERRRFTAAAADLAEQRAQLEADRRALEELIGSVGGGEGGGEGAGEGGGAVRDGNTADDEEAARALVAQALSNANDAGGEVSASDLGLEIDMSELGLSQIDDGDLDFEQFGVGDDDLLLGSIGGDGEEFFNLDPNAE